jgi:hypothetical protein
MNRLLAIKPAPLERVRQGIDSKRKQPESAGLGMAAAQLKFYQ